MKEVFVTDLGGFLAGIGFFALLGATARYINDLGRYNRAFSFRVCLVSCFIGVVVADIVGLVCRHLEVNDELLYAVVGVAAISAKELINTAPKLAVRFLSNRK